MVLPTAAWMLALTGARPAWIAAMTSPPATSVWAKYVIPSRPELMICRTPVSTCSPTPRVPTMASVTAWRARARVAANSYPPKGSRGAANRAKLLSAGIWKARMPTPNAWVMLRPDDNAPPMANGLASSPAANPIAPHPVNGDAVGEGGLTGPMQTAHWAVLPITIGARARPSARRLTRIW